MDDNTRESEPLTEETARRLLARAVELDANRGTLLTLDQLHAAAREVGVSDAAFQQAVKEWTAGVMPALPIPRTPMSHGARVRTWLGARAVDVRKAMVGGPVRNLLALAVAWGVLLVLVSVDRANAVHWLVRKATDPMALMLGAIIASRLRARPVALLLSGLAISQGAELVMDAVLRTPSVQGLGSHLALMIAGVAGVLLGRRAFGTPPANAIEVAEQRARTRQETPATPRNRLERTLASVSIPT